MFSRSFALRNKADSKAQASNRQHPDEVGPPDHGKFIRKANPNYIRMDWREGDGAQLGYVVLPAGIEKVFSMSANGATLGSISRALGIGLKAFGRARERQPEVQEALDLGRGELSTELQDILMMQARKGNTTAAIFLAKARAGWVEQSGQVEGVSKVTHNTVNIQINAPMTEAQVLALMEASNSPPSVVALTATPTPEQQEPTRR